MKKFLKVGSIVTALCLTFTAGVYANNLLEPISAFLNHGITVEYNDVDQVMVDANGAKVIPITYNGSTYLPVRAVSNMLGVNVGWDQATQTVLLGNSYPDVVAPTPVTPPPAPVNPTPTTTGVPTTVTSDKLDISFVFDIANRVAPNQYKVAEYNIEAGDITGTVLNGKKWDVDGDISYTFMGVELKPAGTEFSNPIIATIETEICKALEQAGYTISEVDMFGQKHYTRGDVEFKIWNISQSNSSVRIEVETNWQSYHADN